MSDGYELLASHYDDLQQTVDYPAWADFILLLDQRHHQRTGSGDGREGRPILLDLGCGTGTFAMQMEQHGYDVIGIDDSAAMLQAAREKAQENGSAALFLKQDISHFELYGTVDLATCLLDTLNHLVQPEAVRRVFRLLANYLNPGALFIADVGTRRHFAQTRGNRTIIQDHENLTLVWQNHYRPQSRISRASLTWFARTDDGSYERFDEDVVERYYDHTFLLKAAQSAGLDYVVRTGELTLAPVRGSSERQFYIFRRRIS
ncbi:MAG: class I SAM-dependent methyltransferase [Clostridia bacterium]|nr:class I SAM-dependent methyltransferase [Clostridia bacterium]